MHEDYRAEWLRDHAAGWWLAAKQVAFPIFCKACGATLATDDNGFFCPRCWELSPRVRRPFCTRCGRPHAGAVGLGTRSNFPCARCRDTPLPHVRQMLAPALYDEAVRHAILLLKFAERERLAAPLAELMVAFAQEELVLESYDWVVPVPLYPVRERERGYNQAALLASAVAEACPRARLIHALRRTVPTHTQSLLTGTPRRRNVKGAFSAVNAPATSNGKSVLLVDDVVTTGSTVNECAGTLLRAGAASVDVLAIAFARLRSDPA